MIQVIERAATVLQAVGQANAPTFTELQRATALSKATLSRILASLQELGFVERAPDRSYSIGPFLLELARPALGRRALSGVAERHARRLAEELGELVTVGTVRNGHRYNLARATVERSVVVDADLHVRPSPYDTATGRVMLAHLEPEALDEVVRVNGLPAGTWPGVETCKELTSALKRIREAGHATYLAPDGEAEAIAMPVRGPDGRAWAAVGASVPCYRLDRERRDAVLKALGHAAQSMTEELCFELGETSS